MPRVGVPANFHGKKGRSGRGQDGEYRVLVMSTRKKLLKAIQDDIAGKPVNPRALFWAEKAINRLLPNPVEVTGPEGERLFDYADQQLASIAQRIIDKGRTV